MCRPASMVVTRDKVFWSELSDSHDEIIREFGLTDEVAGRITLVRVEITPPEDNFSAPLDQWIFRVDQDLLPEWAEKDVDKVEARTRDVLVCWAAQKVLTEGTHEVRVGVFYA